LTFADDTVYEFFCAEANGISFLPLSFVHITVLPNFDAFTMRQTI
jgi:hypothetical protein